MKKRFLFILIISIFLTGSAAWNDAHAQAYPKKPIHLVIPYPPGGGTDTIMRPFAQLLSQRLGQPIVIENRGGSGGSLGMDSVARSAPDGYTIVAALTAQLAVNPFLYKNLPYDPVKDFAPITLFAEGPYILVVHPSMPVKTVQEFIEYVRNHPKDVTYASAGNGSGAHLAGELLNTMAGIKMMHVPYKGGGPGLIGLISGEVKASFQTWASSQGHVKAGRIRVLGSTILKRPNAISHIPTISESGVPGYDSGVWYTLLAPAGTPRPIIDRLNSETIAVQKNPEFGKLLEGQSIIAIGSTPEECTQFIKRELAKYEKVVKEAGVRIE